MQTRVSVWVQTAAAIFGAAEDSPNEFTLLEFHSCQHLKEISPPAQMSWNNKVPILGETH